MVSSTTNLLQVSGAYRKLFSKTFDPISIYRVEDVVQSFLSGENVYYVDVNPAYERVMKVERCDIIGRSYLDVWPRAEARWSRIIVSALRFGHAVHCEGYSADADSYMEAIAFPIPPENVAVVFLDKTQWKKSDEALQRKQRQLRNLATQLTLIEENTRREIASDLHDRIGYDLVWQLHKIRAMAEDVPQELRGELRALEDNAEKMIHESRSLIFELSPPILQEVGLNPALESLAEKLLTSHGIKWKMRYSGSSEEFNADDEVCVLLYRMTRELLINVIKHAQADKVTIIVNRGKSKIMVAVDDNGCGFPEGYDTVNLKRVDEEKRASAQSFGLFSIQQRLDPIGGEMKVISVPGKGSTVAMSCPLTLREGGVFA